MVRTASELESKYSRYGGGHSGSRSNGVERQCRTRSPLQDAGAGEVLPKSIVSVYNGLWLRSIWNLTLYKLEQANRGT